ncbi:avidin-like [Pezoporus flaviventris]|uniref:avidin-like n=1 Tax=Pezoporus flaviventris TaxID=889875 RepID=UPI002AB262B3|nr:avidin-like [Pezoporus flaviventris]
MSRRLLCTLAVPTGTALAAGMQIFSQADETPGGEKASMKEAKATSTKRRLGQRQEHSTRKSKVCDLIGWWENDLGSKMLVDKVDSHGIFSGEYYTAVSSTQKPIEPSPLFGTQHLDEDGLCTFGFTVNWKFSDSTAVFVGQRFGEDRGEEVLQTSWMLREKVDSQRNDWKATRVGRNTFKRMA